MEYAEAEGEGISDSRVRDGVRDRRALTKTAALVLVLTAAVLAASLATRALWPALDGAPLVAAWEMWIGQQFLLPTANGTLAPQPPLFLWSIHAGWALAGVSEAWPRLLPALIMLVTLVLTYRLARVFWPGERDAARVAPVVLVGTAGWLVSTTFVGAHMLLVLAVVVGQLALFIAGRHRDGRAWLLLGVALAVGLLAAGAAVLLYLVPAAVLAPLWLAAKPRPVWSHWYGDLLKAAVLGFGLFLVWFVPASQSTPAPLTAWRSLFSLTLPAPAVTVTEVAYPLLAVAVCLPWVVWPWVWTRMWSLRRVPFATAVRFALCAMVPALALLGWLAPTQPQALLPLLPLAAALVAGLTIDADRSQDGALAATMILPLMLLGVALAVLPTLPRINGLPAALWSLSPVIGILIVLVAIALAWLPVSPLIARITQMTVTSAAFASLAVVVLGWQFNRLHDVNAVAQRIAAAQQAGRPVAQVGAYAGEYQFLGRLRAPLSVVAPAQATAWLRDHPQGWLVSDARVWRPASGKSESPAPNQGEAFLRVWELGNGGAPDFVPPVASP